MASPRPCEMPTDLSYAIEMAATQPGQIVERPGSFATGLGGGHAYIHGQSRLQCCWNSRIVPPSSAPIACTIAAATAVLNPAFPNCSSKPASRSYIHPIAHLVVSKNYTCTSWLHRTCHDPHAAIFASSPPTGDAAFRFTLGDLHICLTVITTP